MLDFDEVDRRLGLLAFDYHEKPLRAFAKSVAFALSVNPDEQLDRLYDRMVFLARYARQPFNVIDRLDLIEARALSDAVERLLAIEYTPSGST